MKSNGQYPFAQGPPAVGTAAYYTTGDTPDADDTDPTVCTTAQWQAKWGATNQGMVNFLQQRKGFANTSRVFYLSPSGNNSTAVVNDPRHPYASMAPIMTTLEDLQGGVVIIEGGTYTNGLYLSPCGDNGGNPCWELSGGPGHPLLVMAYPGEVAQVTASPTSGNGLDATGTYSPGRSDCCVIIDGLQFSARYMATEMGSTRRMFPTGSFGIASLPGGTRSSSARTRSMRSWRITSSTT